MNLLTHFQEKPYQYLITLLIALYFEPLSFHLFVPSFIIIIFFNAVPSLTQDAVQNIDRAGSWGV